MHLLVNCKGKSKSRPSITILVDKAVFNGSLQAKIIIKKKTKQDKTKQNKRKNKGSFQVPAIKFIGKSS